MFLYKYGPIKQGNMVLLKLLRHRGSKKRTANVLTVNILMPLPIRRNVVTSQSILK